MAAKPQTKTTPANAVTEGLTRVLADSHALALQTQNFHWNVTGPHFHDLHKFFEALYGELNSAVDEIAERLRALGVYAPGSLGAYARLTAIEDVDRALEAKVMLRRLLEGHTTAGATCRAALASAQDAKDDVTADLLIERIAAHDKAIWMLRSTQV
jgi:starvation-inducible DNA-binding protein